MELNNDENPPLLASPHTAGSRFGGAKENLLDQRFWCIGAGGLGSPIIMYLSPRGHWPKSASWISTP